MRHLHHPGAYTSLWSLVDEHFSQLLTPPDGNVPGTIENDVVAGVAVRDVSRLQGKFMALMVQLSKATRVLEIGTLGGRSTVWMARALPQHGVVVAIEQDAELARICERTLQAANVRDKVDLLIGSVVDVLPMLLPPFDLIVTDAGNPSNPTHLEWALNLSRPGTVIIGDNLLRGGGVVDQTSADPNVRGVRRFLEMLGSEPRLESTAMQTVGEKGWNGFSISIVRD